MLYNTLEQLRKNIMNITTIDKIIEELESNLSMLKKLNEEPVVLESKSEGCWPSFKYLEGEIVGNLTKTRTMAMDDKGYIHSLGYKSDMHIVTDTLKDSIERKDQGYKGFIGNVKASDGYTYFFPAYSNSIGKLNRSTGEITLEEKFGSCPQIRSGAEGANGIIYMPTYTRTLKIYTYNTATGEAQFLAFPSRYKAKHKQ